RTWSRPQRAARAARIKPTPRLKTLPARNSAPTYARFNTPFGCVAVGEGTERKKADGIRMAAIGAPALASHFHNGGRMAWSTYRSMTNDNTRETPACARPAR